MNKKTKNIAKKRKLSWKKDNLIEDKIIKSLEKKLKINKKASKYLPKSFMSDGLDYVLNMCDEENRKIVVNSDKQFKKSSNYYNIDVKLKSTINTKNSTNNSKIKLSNYEKHVEPSIKLDFCKNYELDSDIKNTESNYNEHTKKYFVTNKTNINCKKGSVTTNNILSKKSKIISNKLFKNKNNGLKVDSSKDKLNSDSLKSNVDLNQQTDFQNEDLWEDIYGRNRNKDEIIISENKLALKLNNFENNIENNKKLLFLKKQIKGLLNRLTESNMHVIICELDKLYMSNSRNNMNYILSSIMLESIVAPVLTPERLIIEHMMCIAILHANIGVEIGAYFIMIFIKKLNEMIQQPQFIQNKEVDNLCLMISHLYNFKVFGSQLIYQILEKLINKFTEKEIDLILLLLKTTGFRLRKDDPISLKELIINLQQKAAEMKSSNLRMQFILEILLAIKNNNMNKIPQYDQSCIEHLKKIFKTFIRKGNTISQLNLCFEDLLNVDTGGKWWIVGSAWNGKKIPNNKLAKFSDYKLMYSQKILNLAQTHRMNTDIRKNIFCILMTAEDYLDAFEKLHHLELKNCQEREIIYVILNCLLQEKTFNPYYSAVIQKFCEYDRKYQMIVQCILWDKIKILNSYNNKQVISIAKFISYLFIQKALPLSMLKVIQLGELDTSTMKLFRKIMLDILLYENTEASLHVFERITFSKELYQFREGLRLFMNYFLLKNINKEKIPEKQFHLLEKRIELVDKILMTSASKISF